MSGDQMPCPPKDLDDQTSPPPNLGPWQEKVSNVQGYPQRGRGVLKLRFDWHMSLNLNNVNNIVNININNINIIIIILVIGKVYWKDIELGSRKNYILWNVGSLNPPVSTYNILVLGVLMTRTFNSSFAKPLKFKMSESPAS